MNDTANGRQPGDNDGEDSGAAGGGVVMIALHGLAATAADVDRLMTPLIRGFPAKGIRWLFPKAARRPVTVLGGQEALAWYDVLSWDRSRIDEQGIEAACRLLVGLLDATRRSHGSTHRIVLAGFSQGGALALHAGLRFPAELGGIVALSSALPLIDAVPARRPHSPPVYLAHGWFDVRIPYSFGRESHRLLVSKGYDVEWHAYPIGHWIIKRELLDVASWLERRVLAPGRSEPDASRARSPRPATSMQPQPVQHEAESSSPGTPAE